MKRDITIWIGAVMMLVPLVVWGMSSSHSLFDPERDAPWRVILPLTLAIGAVRMTVLWVQTLRHGIQHAHRENLFSLVLAHISLPLLFPIFYYVASGTAPPAPVATERNTSPAAS